MARWVVYNYTVWWVLLLIEIRATSNTLFEMAFKGTYRDHRVTGALNFHKIRDFCILVMVLDV